MLGRRDVGEEGVSRRHQHCRATQGRGMKNRVCTWREGNGEGGRGKGKDGKGKEGGGR